MIGAGDTISQSGQELLAEFMQYGRERPFEEIVRRYAGMVFNVCFRVTRDKHDAEDATQAVFLTLALQAKRGTEIKVLGPWLQQVAKRLSLDIRRSKKRRKTREERHHTEQNQRIQSLAPIHSEAPADLDEIKAILHEELNKLPAKYRLPLILHYFGGLTREEMATELGCKPSTLGVRVFRGREMLAGRLSSRGVNISLGTFSVALTYTIKSTVTHAMVGYSAAHGIAGMVGGYDALGAVSARVIALTRRASGAMLAGKLKLVGLVLLLAGSSLGAGAKAFGMLPAMAQVRQMISDQVERLMRPLVEPLSLPIQASVQPTAPAPVNLASAENPAVLPEHIEGPAVVHAAPSPEMVTVTPTRLLPGYFNHVAGVVPAGAIPVQSPVVIQMPPVERTFPANIVAASNSSPVNNNDNDAPAVTVASVSDSPATPKNVAPAAARAADPSTDAVESSAPALASAGGEVGLNLPAGSLGATDGTPLVTAVNTRIGLAGASVNQTADRTNAGSVSFSSTNSGNSSTAKTQVIRIPAGQGSVTETNGVLRGWGTVTKTGAFNVDGKVIADGSGIDRTLDLASLSSIQTDLTTPRQRASAGWYAQSHGRLRLAVQTSADHSCLTWGEAPADTVLGLVNSVRLDAPDGGLINPPAAISLLSLDRTDLPPLDSLAAVPIGMWQVDPSTGLVGSSELSVRYDESQVAQLGASESSVELWTYGGSNWTAVDPSTLSVDTADHVVSGDAGQFDYFAVAIPQTPLMAAAELHATPVDQIGPTVQATPTVPEPGAVVLMLMGSGLLLRRRRR